MTAPLVAALAVNSVLNTTGLPWPGGSGFLVGVASAWNANTVTLNFLGPDGVTYIATTFTLSANGFLAISVPQGTIKLTQSGTSTALYVNAAVVCTNLN